jgi:hypothetical protein
MTDFEWVALDPKDYDDAVEVRGVVIDGRPEFLLIRRVDEASAPWQFHVVLHRDTEGFGGMEHIDYYPTLAAAQEAAEPAVREFLSEPG